MLIYWSYSLIVAKQTAIRTSHFKNSNLPRTTALSTDTYVKYNGNTMRTYWDGTCNQENGWTRPLLYVYTHCVSERTHNNFIYFFIPPYRQSLWTENDKICDSYNAIVYHTMISNKPKSDSFLRRLEVHCLRPPFYSFCLIDMFERWEIKKIFVPDTENGETCTVRSFVIWAFRQILLEGQNQSGTRRVGH